MIENIRSGGVPNVLAVLRNVHTGHERHILGRNIVTNDGDIWYARKAGGSSYFTVAGLRLGTGTATPTKSDTDVTTALAAGSVATDAGYPKTDDDDADNSSYASADSNTWRFSFGTGIANGNDIIEGAIVDSLTTPTKAVTHFKFGAAFNKTTSDTLKVFCSHNFLGS